MARSRRSAAAKSARPSCPMAPPTVRCVDTCGSGQPPAALALRAEQPLRLRLRRMLAVALAGRAMLGAGSDMTEPWSMTGECSISNDTDMLGSGITGGNIPHVDTPSKCCDLCASHPDCRGWVLHPPHFAKDPAKCFLKTNSPHTNGKDEVTQDRAFFNKEVFPRLGPHQAAAAVPGVFACSNFV